MSVNGEARPSGKELTENESLELRLLLEAIYLRYGYDFRSYAKASIKRRVRSRMRKLGVDNISQLLHEILYSRAAFDALLLDLSVSVTEMFRDSSFFKTVRESVLPLFEGQSHLKVWHAGCATGEEVYSMAIMLRETGLTDRCRVYATDINEVVLRQAKEGIYPIDKLQEYTANYQKAGGTESFADYYTASYDSVMMNADLKKNMLFAAHNLVTDGVFGEMDIIVCRNVLIYFDRDLQDRVVRLFADSLAEGGILCLGAKESIRFAQCAGEFDDFDQAEKIYRKKPGAVSSGME